MQASLTGYLTDLASQAPVPGGGAVAALTGAQAAALISMVCKLTHSDDQNTAAKVNTISNTAQASMHTFLQLAETDARAFTQVINSYQLPKGSKQERQMRARSIQTALQVAVSPPLKVAVTASHIAILTAELFPIGNKNLLTDLGIAALLIPATISAAEMNIEINLRSIKDKEFTLEVREQLSASKTVMQNMEQLASRITQMI